jgi:ATP-dependent DNA helicase RecG
VKTFDRRPCLGAGSDELLLDIFRNEYLPRAVAPDVLALNEQTLDEQMASLGFFDLGSGRPTHAGILITGRDPLAYLPGAFVQLVRFAGNSPADPIQDQKEITGNLMTQLRRVDDLLPLQITTARVPAEGLRFEDIPDYPQFAIRELLMNAVMHRTYEGTSAPVRVRWFRDRVEILSPGGLYGQVTPLNFERVSDYRNPVIAVAMKVLGYMERYGTGIARAKAMLKSNGNPPPEFEFEPTHVHVTLRRRT